MNEPDVIRAMPGTSGGLPTPVDAPGGKYPVLLNHSTPVPMASAITSQLTIPAITGNNQQMPSDRGVDEAGQLGQEFYSSYLPIPKGGR